MKDEMSEMGEMGDRVALVTGGSSGIGKATAMAFAALGAKVAIASRTQTTGEAVARAIREAGGEAMWIQADVSDAAQVASMVGQVVDAYGRLDWAFNNAGSGGKGGWVPEIQEEDWDKTIAGYLKSVWLCMKHEIPRCSSWAAARSSTPPPWMGSGAFPGIRPIRLPSTA